MHFHYILAMAPDDGSEPIRFFSQEVDAENINEAYAKGAAELNLKPCAGWSANDYVVADGLGPMDHAKAEGYRFRVRRA